MESIKSCGLGPTVLLLIRNVAEWNHGKYQTEHNQYPTLPLAAAMPMMSDFVVDKGIALSENVSHLVFKELTFDASAPSDGWGVNMKGRCVNIEFRNCKIYASPTTTRHLCF